MKLRFFFLLSFIPVFVFAQVSEYKAFTYSSKELTKEIQQLQLTQDSVRSIWKDMGKATLNSMKGIGAGYVSSFIDMGVNAIASLINRKSKMEEEWLQMVTVENKWSTQINSIHDMSDFYDTKSESGALDPKGMMFDGIGCVRKEGNDTVFFISCHINRDKLYRITNHSKFELVLDTLIVNPFKSHLPNSAYPIDFSFEERRNFLLSMNISLTSSWFSDNMGFYTDEKLGEFNISIPVNPNELDTKGNLRYVRKEGETSKYEVLGESFIVPRSYMGYRNSEDEYMNIWGTGQYKLSITLNENCDITESYRNNWNEDRKRREAMSPKEGFLSSVWQTVSSQQWDDITQSWVITTLSAPAGIITNELIDKLGLEQQ